MRPPRNGPGGLVRLGLTWAAILALSAQAAPPDWVRRAGQLPTPAGVGNAPAVVLLDETSTTVFPDGRNSIERHVVLRILNREGCKDALGSVDYLDKHDRIEDQDAWLVRNDRVVSPAGDRKWIDLTAAAPGAIFDEGRVQQIDYSDLAAPGDLFAFKTVVTGRMLFAQAIYNWDWNLPVVAERVSLHLPPAWTTVSTVRGLLAPAASISPDRSTYVWELDNQPYRAPEPWVDPSAEQEAELMVTMVPPGDSAAQTPAFQKWTDVVAYQDAMNAGQCDSDASLAAKASQLCAGCTDDLSRIRVLAYYVQKLRYVAINRNLHLGFGYRPRKATEVLAKGYGDCKDKANLLKAMLRQVGIQSYPAAAESWDDGGALVYPEWPSPYQFNHVILAIAVGAGTSLPSVVTTPNWGALLFFDPTNTATALGDLPWYLQGTNVLVLEKGCDRLIALPQLAVEENRRVERRATLALAANGLVTGECSILGQGQSGADWRRRIQEETLKELHYSLSESFGANLRGAVIQDLTPVDDPADGRCGIRLKLSAPQFVQPLSGGLAIVRLNILPNNLLPVFSAKERSTPLATHPLLLDDEVRLNLPAGYTVEELPNAEKIRTSFGSYEKKYEMAEGVVTCRRSLRIDRIVVPVAGYPEFRKFLADVARFDRSTVLLRQIPQPGS